MRYIRQAWVDRVNVQEIDIVLVMSYIGQDPTSGLR